VRVPQVTALAVLTLAAALAQGAAQGVAALGGLGAQDNGKPIGIEASNGIEWQQNNRVYIAHGDAKATRGDTTVAADTLYAYYRPVVQKQAVAVSKKGSPDPVAGGGSTEI
jgi:lipopolysaccharide export system protein LptA